MKTTLILNHECKKLPSAKNSLEDFSCFVVIVQVWLHRVSKSHIEFSGCSDQVTALFYRGMFTRETVKQLCQMMPGYRVFVFVSFLFLSIVINFDKKCANSTQRSQSPNSQRLTIVSGKSKIYSPRQGDTLFFL